jgi:hypothetical protein
MKKVLFLALALGVIAAGCGTDNNNTVTPTPVPVPVVQDKVSGEVSGVWEKGSTYKITGHISIPAGKSLTISEGTTVLFSDSTIKPEFIINGNLYVLGTKANPVKFTVPDAWKTAGNVWGSLWGGLIASSTCAEMVIDNAIMEYGGAVTTETSPSVKAGLYKAAAGNHVPAINYANVNGKLVIQNTRMNNQNEDGWYIEGGKVIIANNVIYTQGISGGDAINIKSGVEADVCFNLVYSPNTNALKLSNTGTRTPQAYIIGYNNTIVNAGWRRPTIKGGSVWVEVGVRSETYNTLFVNDRFGVKRDPKSPEDQTNNRSKVSNNLYYANTAEGVTGFQPSTEVLAGTNDIISKVTGDNDPKFVNYTLSTAGSSFAYNTAWDFRLMAGSPAIGKGTTAFTPLYSTTGLTLGGRTYKSPAPSTTIGAYGTN